MIFTIGGIFPSFSLLFSYFVLSYYIPYCKLHLQESQKIAIHNSSHYILSCTISHVLFYISVFLFLVLSSIHCFPSILNCLPYITPLLESSSVQCTLSFHNFLLSLKSCMSFSQQSYFPSCLPRLVSSYLCPPCLVSNNTCLMSCLHLAPRETHNTTVRVVLTISNTTYRF